MIYVLHDGGVRYQFAVLLDIGGKFTTQSEFRLLLAQRLPCDLDGRCRNPQEPIV